MDMHNNLIDDNLPQQRNVNGYFVSRLALRNVGTDIFAFLYLYWTALFCF